MRMLAVLLALFLSACEPPADGSSDSSAKNPPSGVADGGTGVTKAPVEETNPGDGALPSENDPVDGTTSTTTPPLPEADPCQSLQAIAGEWYGVDDGEPLIVECSPSEGKCAVSVGGEGALFEGELFGTQLALEAVEGVWKAQLDLDGPLLVQRTLANEEIQQEVHFER